MSHSPGALATVAVGGLAFCVHYQMLNFKATLIMYMGKIKKKEERKNGRKEEGRKKEGRKERRIYLPASVQQQAGLQMSACEFSVFPSPLHVKDERTL